MHLRYRFRAYPTAPQRISLARLFGCVRVVYNDAVAARKSARAAGLPYPTTAMLDRRLITEAKQTPEREWLTEVSTVPLQQALRDCHAAYRAFFDSRRGRRRGPNVGPPRFRRRSHRQTARFTRNGFSLRPNGRVYLAKVGELAVRWSRELPAVPSSATVERTATGNFFVSFVVVVEPGAELLDPLPVPEADTGIDLGLHEFAVLRGGKVIENPRFFKRMERRLAKAQRMLSRKTAGSANREKARLNVARIHEKAGYRRSDWIHKHVKTIVAENQGIFVEDLHVGALSRGLHAKSFREAAFGIFLRRLEVKAVRAGRSFRRVDRYFPSTRLCSACAAVTGPRGLGELKVCNWICECGAVHDRDANAELNLRREGRRLENECRMVAAGHAET
ncbi:RNA-guided endonuclease InsQ/TnpB family protein [Glycomyces dulcitolivorans]|uniref:RNA-guided endonuclease InsQ/TnpB family protein n=1 Tax=Glycomyces dulcitolivorans TaxID=2200759 RepID=UPI000DD4C1D8|nr:RNA-guided endonuclease TnpB family protein [Glycomyces dulcitolivorans]